MTYPIYIRELGEVGLDDVAIVGGKTAALGELHRALASRGVHSPDGFAITAQAYRDALDQGPSLARLRMLLEGLDGSDVNLLAQRAAQARAIVYKATGGGALRNEIVKAWRDLKKRCGAGLSVAVRSSATAEDLPNASFAGQHESYLNIRGEKELVEACRKCFASIFTDRAIVYRLENGFDHFKVALSVVVMKMVRSDRASSGVIFTLDTESGFRDVVFITGGYGLGENIVQGAIDPDEYFVHKPTFRAGQRAILRRRLGEKQLRMVYATGAKTATTTLNQKTPRTLQARFCLSDSEVLELAGQAICIEDHFSALAGQPTPMDIEWAKDGRSGALYIVQARPETVISRRSPATVQSYVLTGHAPILVRGRAVGEKIAVGAPRIIASLDELHNFRPGEILVADTTTPDWQPVMKQAAAIITNRGGRTCHAAIVARELGVPAIVGTSDATRRLRPGETVTVSCAEGDEGRVYEGAVEFETRSIDLDSVPRPRTQVMVNLGDPDLAFHTALLPAAGVGLARMEFIIREHIGFHPMAMAQPETVASPRARAAIVRAARGYADPAAFFVQRLSEGVGTIAAAFYPREVIVRLSDFKTNEYAGLTGGAGFEPKEENPMLGFRGASRYDHPSYSAGFALECAALRHVRESMGLTNLQIMVPFVRTETEAVRVVAALERNGLMRGQNGLRLFMMCEIPNNVIRIDAFSQFFDGFSIGSNDLTQLTLGVDRDSDIVAMDFDERDPGVMEMLRLAVTGARRNGRHVGICGEAPATYPEIAAALVRWGIDSISVNPSSLIAAIQVVAEAEAIIATA